MSIDAGGLAQMTFQGTFNNTNIGISGPGFASRGKGSHIKRLSVAPPSKISTIDETQQANSVSTPRTSRGHLLAGLRTAPKSAVVPSGGLDQSKYADAQYDAGTRGPQTTTAAFFPQPQGRKASNGGGNMYQQEYGYTEQVLAPPTLEFGHGLEGIDPDEYEQLVATNKYLALQQRQLQQQLSEIAAAAQQFGHMNLNTQFVNPQQYQSPVNTPMSASTQQQYQSAYQPIVQPVPGNPGIYSVYNPVTGQYSYVYDNSFQQQNGHASVDNYGVASPQVTAAPVFQRQASDPSVPRSQMRSVSPPKPTPSPQTDVEPLPPPSANAFRRGHRKNMSSANVKTTGDWARTTGPRSAGVPATPMTGNFEPGHGRAGEHPVRQPKGPPLLQELQEKPTSKHEGSKNFAARQRRRAVHDLVKAGRERRSDVRQPGSGSGSGTPASENEFNFSASGSDSDSVLAGSTSLTSKPSIGSLRAAANGAIGSERKEKSRDRSSVDSGKSMSGDERIGYGYAEMESHRSTPLLVLSSADQRKSVVM